MTEEPISAEETAVPSSASSNVLLLDVSLGLLLPGVALILAPTIILVGSSPIATAMIMIAEMFILSVHLGLQDSPAYAQLAPLLIAPLALAPIFAVWHALALPGLVSLIALLPAIVFVRAALHAGKHLR